MREDSFIGKEFPTPKGGVLTVVGSNGLKGDKLRYICECSVCSKDDELFPYGSILPLKSTLTRGKCPCGCIRNHNKNEKQILVLIDRECKLRGYTFKGFHSTYKNRATKIKLYCPSCDDCWTTTTIGTFLKGTGCPSCKNKKISNDLKHVWEGKTRVNLKGVTQTIVKTEGRYNVYYECSVCGLDKELFPLPFKTVKSDWKKNTKNSCGCGVYTNWTRDQYRTICQRISTQREDLYTFKGFHGEWEGCYTKVHLECEIHGSWYSQTIDKYTSNKPNGCPSCARDNSYFGYYPHREYEEDLLYLIIFHNQEESFIKVGRTFDLHERCRDYRLSPYNFHVLSTQTDTHNGIYKLEQDIHARLKKQSLHYKPLKPFSGSVLECFELKALEDDIIKLHFE